MRHLGRYRHLAGLASGSVGAMAVQAFSSFILQVLAAGTIGAAGYGKLTIVIGLMSTLTAVRAGIDDSPVVLEQHDADLRRPVLTAQYCSVFVVSMVALVVGVSSDLTTAAGSVLLALVVLLWSLEEMGRRYFMRDQRFGALVLNDLAYAAGALAAIGVQYRLADDLTLSSFLWAICAGSTASFLLAISQLPNGTFHLRQLSFAGMGTVLRFAGWRSGQVSIRPLSVTLTRVGVAAVASAEVLGNLETARLILQPVWVAVSGLGPFLLTHYVRSELRSPGIGRRRSLLTVTVALMALAGAWGIGAVVATDLFQTLFAGGDITVDRIAVAAWTVFYVASASGLPIMNVLVAQRDTFGAFSARLVDGVCGVALAVAIAWSFGAAWAPVGLAVGAAAGALLMWRRLVRGRELTGSPAAATSPA